jgi:hypothetical protein
METESSVPPPEDQPQSRIEAGEVRGDGLRLWCAREALRQGEMHVSGQMAAQALMVGRASSGLGWSITLALALAATSSAFRDRFHVALPISALLIAAVVFMVVSWPKAWGVIGDDPRFLLDQPYDSELETVEALALRAAMAADRNARQLARLSWCIRAGNIMMLVAVGLSLWLAASV